jgi:hypothetical protein
MDIYGKSQMYDGAPQTCQFNTQSLRHPSLEWAKNVLVQECAFVQLEWVASYMIYSFQCVYICIYIYIDIDIDIDMDIDNYRYRYIGDTLPQTH